MKFKKEMKSNFQNTTMYVSKEENNEDTWYFQKKIRSEGDNPIKDMLS